MKWVIINLSLSKMIEVHVEKEIQKSFTYYICSASWNEHTSKFSNKTSTNKAYCLSDFMQVVTLQKFKITKRVHNLGVINMLERLSILNI